MKCLKCCITFSPDDILVMEDWEMPVCDVCDAEEYHILVYYNGNEDLIDFSGRKVSKKVCNICIRGNYELVSINYGAAVICPNCKVSKMLRHFCEKNSMTYQPKSHFINITTKQITL